MKRLWPIILFVSCMTPEESALKDYEFYNPLLAPGYSELFNTYYYHYKINKNLDWETAIDSARIKYVQIMINVRPL